MIVKFKEIADYVAGQSPESKYYSNTEGVPFLQGNRTFGLFYPTIDTYTKKITKIAKKGDILMSVRAPVGDLNIAKEDLCIGRGLSAISSKTGNNIFLFYSLKYNIQNLIRQSSGTTFDSITRDVIENMNMIIPDDKSIHLKISKLLFDIDLKIDINNKINVELESMAKTLYDYWFLQFEFPNEDGKPYKSSGGKMVWNEELKREIPEGWELKHAYEIADIKTGKEDANHSTENGKYPFFTCSNDILRCDDYKFEGNVILIAGNGDFNVKHYNGKFNAYQRTYVIKPYDEKYIGLFHICCNQTVEQFKKGSNGSIVKFITLSDIQNIKMLDCKNNNLLTTFNISLEQIDCLKKENEELSSLRDFLLPLLMNGQVTFKS